MVRRGGARAGDRVMVTGTIGDAALGLLLRRDPRNGARWRLDARAARSSAAAAISCREPRNALAEAVLAHASAAMDVSDGLVGDLAKLCRASGVAAEIEVARVPLSEAARAALAAEPALIETILTGGDDYEVLATRAAGQARGVSRGPRRRPASRSPRSGRSSDRAGADGASALSRSGRQAACLRACLLQPFLSGWPSMRAAR